MISRWTFPAEIVAGEGAALKLGEEAKKLGGRSALLIADRTLHQNGTLQPLLASLKSAGVEASIIDDFEGAPSEPKLLEASEKARADECDLFIGVGGEGSIDAAKLLRLLSAHPPPLAQYAASNGDVSRLSGHVPPMIAIPTAESAGRELSPFAFLESDEHAENGLREAIFRSRRLLPELIILDPELSRIFSPRHIAIAGMDTLTRAIEAFCAFPVHPAAEAIAIHAVELLQRYLPQAVEEADQESASLEARARLLEASMMSGGAAEKGLGAATSLARALSLHAGVERGLASAICLPAALEFNRLVAPDKLAKIASIFGARSEDEMTLASEAPSALSELRARVGLEASLSALTIPQGSLAESLAGSLEDSLPTLADLAAADEALKTNPRPATSEDLLALYRSVL